MTTVGNGDKSQVGLDRLDGRSGLTVMGKGGTVRGNGVEMDWVQVAWNGMGCDVLPAMFTALWIPLQGGLNGVAPHNVGEVDSYMAYRRMTSCRGWGERRKTRGRI